MRRISAVAAALCGMLAATVVTPAPAQPVVVAAVSETVYVESTTDSDGDGARDRIAAASRWISRSA